MCIHEHYFICYFGLIMKPTYICPDTELRQSDAANQSILYYCYSYFYVTHVIIVVIGTDQTVLCLWTGKVEGNERR